MYVKTKVASLILMSKICQIYFFIPLCISLIILNEENYKETLANPGNTCKLIYNWDNHAMAKLN